MEEHFHKNLSHLRRDYAKGDLHKHQIAANPFTQFSQWFQEMQQAGFVEPNAMFVATVNAAGQPSMRTVLLKEFTAEGFVFYTNQHSRKGKDIAENDQVALLFYWDKLEQQIRIEGKASIFPEQKAEAYFNSRPWGSKIGAWASPQSEKIHTREVLEENYMRYAKQFPHEVPKPPHWGGYLVKPYYFEFWQGRSNRLHDRISYTLAGNNTWEIVRLAP